MEDNFSQESNKNQETGSSLDNFIYPQVHIENESLNLKNSVFKGLFYGKPVALKKVEYESTVNVRNKVDVEKLLSLRNENIVTYHYFFIRDSTSRYKRRNLPRYCLLLYQFCIYLLCVCMRSHAGLT